MEVALWSATDRSPVGHWQTCASHTGSKNDNSYNGACWEDSSNTLLHMVILKLALSMGFQLRLQVQGQKHSFILINRWLPVLQASPGRMPAFTSSSPSIVHNREKLPGVFVTGSHFWFYEVVRKPWACAVQGVMDGARLPTWLKLSPSDCSPH